MDLENSDFSLKRHHYHMVKKYLVVDAAEDN